MPVPFSAFSNRPRTIWAWESSGTVPPSKIAEASEKMVKRPNTLLKPLPFSG